MTIEAPDSSEVPCCPTCGQRIEPAPAPMPLRYGSAAAAFAREDELREEGRRERAALAAAADIAKGHLLTKVPDEDLPK